MYVSIVAYLCPFSSLLLRNLIAVTFDAPQH